MAKVARECGDAEGAGEFERLLRGFGRLMKRAHRLPPPQPAPPDVAALSAPQLDLFPTRASVETLRPQAVSGPRTGVKAVIRVRIAPTAPAHLVFHDRHGWYCETHGASCAAVGLARAEFGVSG